jgi:hypothetical protein
VDISQQRQYNGAEKIEESHRGYAMLILVLEELVREGRIKIRHGKDRDIISLISR